MAADIRQTVKKKSACNYMAGMFTVATTCSSCIKLLF